MVEARLSPVVEVTDEHLADLTDVQIGHRVLAALAHTPAERELGSYHAICVSKNADKSQYLPEDVLEAQYDTCLSWKISPSDAYRADVGEKIRTHLEGNDEMILGRS